MNSKVSKNLLVWFLALMAAMLTVLPLKSAFASNLQSPVITMSPVIPTNQVHENEGFWDLIMQPGASQTLEVKISNSSSVDYTLNTAVTNATTSANGQVIYIPNSKDKGKAVVNYQDNVSVAKSVTVPAKGSITVPITVNMPNNDINGVAAGAVVFTESDSLVKASKASTSDSSQVANRFQYSLGLVMRQHGESDIIPADLTMDSAAMKTYYAHTVVDAHLVNHAAGFVNNMYVDAKVTGPTDFTYENAQMQMAPNSDFHLQMPALNKKNYDINLKPGKYTLKMVVYGDQKADGQYKAALPNKGTANYGQRWTFTRHFTVSANKANDINKQSGYQTPKSYTWIWITIVVSLMLLVSGLGYWVRNSRKRMAAIKAENERLKRG